MSQPNNMKPPEGPPYPAKTAGLGGVPNAHLDIPVTAVFIFLFLLGGAGHMTTLQLNLRRGHKFPLSGAMFGWSMARILACSMRIAWGAHPSNVPLAIAAGLLLNIGDLLGFVININLAQRIVRALHPRWGWHPVFKWFLIVVYFLIVATMFILIGFSIDSSYTLDPQKLKNARDGILYGVSYFAFAGSLALFLIAIALALPRKTEPEQFGRGGLKRKILITVYGSTLLALGAWFRAGSSYMPPRPIPLTKDYPYLNKACFYVFYFTIENIVIWSYLLLRIDRVFYVPDGSKGPGDYARSRVTEKEDVQASNNVEIGAVTDKHQDTELRETPDGELVGDKGTESQDSSAADVTGEKATGLHGSSATEVVGEKDPELRDPTAKENGEAIP